MDIPTTFLVSPWHTLMTGSSRVLPISLFGFGQQCASQAELCALFTLCCPFLVVVLFVLPLHNYLFMHEIYTSCLCMLT
eukprot:m.179918 g.179918  ORF g.179918 m.179918 type:complete len:79 (+) comp14651_c1_seq1:5719-5955(+)